MVSLTTNYSFNLPAIGGDINLWGGYLNDNFDELDTLLDTIETAVAANTAGLATKQPLDATLTALAGLTVAANKGIYATAADAFATFDLTAFGRSIGSAADAAAARILLELIKQTSTVDTTAGSLLTVGAFGLGGQVIGTYSADADTIPTSGMYALASGAAHSPDSTQNFYVLHFAGATSATAVQLAINRNPGREGEIATRSKSSSAWTDWGPIIGNRGTVASAAMAGEPSVDVSFSAATKRFCVKVINVVQPAGSLYFRVREEGLGVVTTGVYDYTYVQATNSANTTVAGADAASEFSVGGASGVTWNGVIYGEQVGDTDEWHITAHLRQGATRRITTLVGNVTMGGALNGFRLQMSAGNFTSGEFVVDWEA
jgi:hypothetical protein